MLKVADLLFLEEIDMLLHQNDSSVHLEAS